MWIWSWPKRAELTTLMFCRLPCQYAQTHFCFRPLLKQHLCGWQLQRSQIPNDPLGLWLQYWKFDQSKAVHWGFARDSKPKRHWLHLYPKELPCWNCGCSALDGSASPKTAWSGKTENRHCNAKNFSLEPVIVVSDQVGDLCDAKMGSHQADKLITLNI